jgi:hypothetical protein
MPMMLNASAPARLRDPAVLAQGSGGSGFVRLLENHLDYGVIPP